MRRSIWMVSAALGCTGTDDSAPIFCDEACTDYYVVRAVDDVHTKVWSAVLSSQQTPYVDVAIPCIEGSITTNGDGTLEADKSVTLDISMDFAGCKQSDPSEAGGYEVVFDGLVEWDGSFSADSQIRNFTYQSSELAIAGTVYELGDPQEVDESCTLQASLTATSQDEFSFAGSWCSRSIEDPTVD